VIGIRSDWWFGWLVIFVLDIRRAFDTHNVPWGWDGSVLPGRRFARPYEALMMAIIFFFSISAAFALDLVVDVC
jgi:hypothetical protein